MGLTIHNIDTLSTMTEWITITLMRERGDGGGRERTHVWREEKGERGVGVEGEKRTEGS